jgi:subtilisin family serine protease
MNWAITNQAAHDIAAINLSFGLAPEDGLAHGYCDDLYADYVQAIDAANAAGIVVVIASGTEGLVNAIAAPACVSNAVSVGAVYPDSFARGLVDDSGGVCARLVGFAGHHRLLLSNSNLSLLAPGAFWLVVTGAARGVFHGTSVSSPAVAGAAALMRQAHPELDIRDRQLLKTTGCDRGPAQWIATPHRHAGRSPGCQERSGPTPATPWPLRWVRLGGRDGDGSGLRRHARQRRGRGRDRAR